VYRTIDKILYLTKVLYEQKRAKKPRKRKLKASEEVLLKTSTPEDRVLLK